MTLLIEGLTIFLGNPYNIAAISGGISIGILVGALPGLGPVAVIAIALPFTYIMNSLEAMMLLLGIYIGGIYGGSITAILLNSPGTPNSAATLIDGYPMAQQGKARKALKMALYGSVIGGIVSAVCLLLIAPLLARVALKFGPAEYFAIIVFSLTVIGSVSGKSLLKGLICATIGILLSTIGLCPISGTSRFNFDNINLSSGLSIIAMLIGIFALSEVMFQAEKAIMETGKKSFLIESGKREDQRVSLKELLRMKWLLLRSSVIGITIGILPGIGAVTASFISYGAATRASKEPEKFGKGALEGVAAAETANNAVTGAALIPLLVLGIPGDVVTAVLLGALIIHGMVPGPELFHEQGPTMYALILGLLAGNIIMLLIGLIFVRFSTFITGAARHVVVPVTVTLCIVGTYAINNSFFDLQIMFIFGVVGYFMRKRNFPIPPLIIAFILGPMAEINLRQA
ncbi:MAG: tripartite tricarboxylate transporter permease [Proteobacteria bacterium]|nr:tripartite tricarboxylate transporter permease [Pseudomonadota bacterium]